MPVRIATSLLLVLMMALGAAAYPVEGAAAVPSTVQNLDHLVALAIERHPAVAAQRAQVQSLIERSHGVSLPDPMLSVTPVGAMAETAAGEVSTMLSLSQRFPGPGKLAAQSAEFQAAASVAEAGVREQAVAIALAVRQAWWRWHEAVRTAQVLGRQRELLDELRQSVSARVQANLGSTASLLRIGVEIGSIDARLAGIRERALSAEASLRAALALEPEQAIPSLLEQPDVSVLPGDLLAIAEGLHPAFQLSRAEQRTAAAMARSAAVRRRPDFTVFANYNLVDDAGLSMAANGDDQWWVGAGISVPLWGGAYSAGERAADAAARRASFRRLAARNQVRRDLAIAAAGHAAASEQYEIYSQRLLPEASQAVEAERGIYAAGTGSFADLVMSVRQLLDLELNSVRYAHEMGLQHAALLAAAGLLSSSERESDHD